MDRDLISMDDLDALEGLNERYRVLLDRLEAETEAAAAFDAPVEQANLRALKSESVRLRGVAAAKLKEMLSRLEPPTD